MKHVYANPRDPVICNILSLAMYLLVNPTAGFSKDKQLFPGYEKQH